jgi:hypothetical protein
MILWSDIRVIMREGRRPRGQVDIDLVDTLAT